MGPPGEVIEVVIDDVLIEILRSTALYLDVFVHPKLLTTALIPPPQPQQPNRVIAAIFDPFVHEEHPALHVQARRTGVNRGYFFVDFFGQFGCQVLVGVHAHEPGGGKGIVFYAKIKLEGVGNPGILYHHGTQTFGDGYGIVGRVGIDDEKLVRDGSQTFETAANVPRFVVREDDYREIGHEAVPDDAAKVRKGKVKNRMQFLTTLVMMFRRSNFALYRIQKMHIFFTTGSLYPAQIGGPDNVIYWWAKSLVRLGHSVTIATTDDGIGDKAPINQWLETEYGRVIYVKTKIHYAPIKLLIRSLIPLWRCEILHIGAIFYPTSWILAALALLLGKKVIWTPHGELDPEALVYSPARKKPILWFVKNILSKGVLFHSTCAAETDYIHDNFGMNSAVVQIPPKIELPERLNLPTEHYLLYIGRLHPKKAVENLIEAVALSTKFRTLNFELRVAGTGEVEYMNYLTEIARRKGVADKMRFVGHTEGPAKQELLAAAYFSFMPSHTENFGIVVTEALAHGTPVVASKTTPWAILEKMGSGYWVDNSVESLVKVIDHILKMNPIQYQKMRKNSIETAQLFDIARHGEDWVNIYEDLLAGRTDHQYPYFFE